MSVKAVDPTGHLTQKSGAIHAVVTRADGTIENRGIIAYSHRNPIINFILSPLARLNGFCWERWYRLKRKWS